MKMALIAALVLAFAGSASAQSVDELKTALDGAKAELRGCLAVRATLVKQLKSCDVGREALMDQLKKLNEYFDKQALK